MLPLTVCYAENVKLLKKTTYKLPTTKLVVIPLISSPTCSLGLNPCQSTYILSNASYRLSNTTLNFYKIVVFL